MASHSTAEERTDDVVLDKNYTFEKMLLPEGILQGLAEAGFVYPSMIQKKGIPIGRCGYDLLVQSKSGTGKTLVFSIIALEKFKPDVTMPQTLILSPTREIAVQTADTLKLIGKYIPGFKTSIVIGGLSIQDNRTDLQGCSAVVGTPGRILHLIELQVLNTKHIDLLILDEVDQLTDQNFNLSTVLDALPKNIQTITVSATLDKQAEERIRKFTRNPIGISPAREIPVLLGIGQFVYQLAPEPGLEMLRKFTKLKEILSTVNFKQCFVFTNSQSLAESYKKLLAKEDWPSEVITGAYEQSQRLSVLRKLKEFKIRVLLSTDLMARGIDSENVNLVINMDVPRNGMIYLHRIGRAGRFGTKGVAITLVATEEQRKQLNEIQEQFGMTGVMELPEKIDSKEIWELVDRAKEKIIKEEEKVEEKSSNEEDDTLALLLDSSNLNEDKADEEEDQEKTAGDPSANLFKEFEQFSETDIPVKVDNAAQDLTEVEDDPLVTSDIPRHKEFKVTESHIEKPSTRRSHREKPQRSKKKSPAIILPDEGPIYCKWTSLFYSQYAMISHTVQSNSSYSKKFPRY